MKTDFPTMLLLQKTVKLSGGEQRDMLRKIVGRMITSASEKDREEFDTAIKNAIKASPICGDGDKQINPKPTGLGVLKSMSNETLMALALGDRALTYVPDAIRSPDTHSLIDSSTTTGFRFGWTFENDPFDKEELQRDHYMSWASDSVEEGYEGGFIPNWCLGTFDSVGDASEETAPVDAGGFIPDMTLDEVANMFTKLVSQAIAVEGDVGDKITWSFQKPEDKDRFLNTADKVAAAMRGAFPDHQGHADTKSYGAMTLLQMQANDPDYDAAGEMELTPEAEAVAEVIRRSAPEVFAPTEDNDDAVAEVAPFEVALDPSLETGINSLLKNATGGAYEGLEDILRAASVDAASKVQHDVLRQAQPVFDWKEAAVTSSSTEIPEGEVTYKKSFEIFTNPDGTQFTGDVKKMLNFDVPVWVWDGDHPNVPEVDPHYIFDPKTLIQFLNAIRLGRNPWLYGHTGTGKSTFVTQVAARLCQPMLRINFDSEMTRLDLVGREVLMNDGGVTVSKFVDGVLPTAIAGPYWLLCDEQSYIRADVAFVYQRVLEEGKTLMLTEDAGRTVHPHPFFRIIATCNTKGQGDEFGCYQGARPQAASFLDRFRPFLEVDYLSREQEQQLISLKVPGMSTDAAEKLTQFAEDARKSFANMETQMPVSPRGVIAVAEDYVFYEGMMKEQDAMQLALHSNLLDRASTQDRVLLKGIADRVLA